MHTLLPITLRNSLTMPFSSGMSSFLTSINSNLTFALRRSWNTTPLTEPSSIFYSWEHLTQLWNVQFSPLYSVIYFSTLFNKYNFPLNRGEKSVPSSPYNCTIFPLVHLWLYLYVLMTPKETSNCFSCYLNPFLILFIVENSLSQNSAINSLYNHKVYICAYLTYCLLNNFHLIYYGQCNVILQRIGHFNSKTQTWSLNFRLVA